MYVVWYGWCERVYPAIEDESTVMMSFAGQCVSYLLGITDRLACKQETNGLRIGFANIGIEVTA